MSEKFPLLQQLQNPQANSSKQTPLPKGIKYETRTVIVESEEIEVFIPSREASEFDRAFSDGKYIDQHEFSMLMRKHRGIRNRE